MVFRITDKEVFSFALANLCAVTSRTPSPTLPSLLAANPVVSSPVSSLPCLIVVSPQALPSRLPSSLLLPQLHLPNNQNTNANSNVRPAPSHTTPLSTHTRRIRDMPRKHTACIRMIEDRDKTVLEASGARRTRLREHAS